MAFSPAKRHHSRVLAELEAQKRNPGELMAGAGIYEQHLSELQGDRLRLKQVQSDKGKAELKRVLLPKYADYLAGVLRADSGATDIIVTELMVWYIDVGDYEQALKLGAYVLRHKLGLPDRYTRTTGCVFAEEVAEAALAAHRSNEPFPLFVLEETATLTAGEDMPDEVRAKLFLAYGRIVLAGLKDDMPPSLGRDHATLAVSNLHKAIGLHGACGGKKDLERAERLLKKFSVEPQGSPPSSEVA